MINLTDSTQELRVVLGATPTGSPPNECHCYASYRETTDSTYEFGNARVFTTGAVTKGFVFGSSVSSTIRAIDHVSIYNPDTPSPTVSVTVIFYDGTDEYILVKKDLLEDQTLTYNDKQGWTVI